MCNRGENKLALTVDIFKVFPFSQILVNALITCKYSLFCLSPDKTSCRNIPGKIANVSVVI